MSHLIHFSTAGHCMHFSLLQILLHKLLRKPLPGMNNYKHLMRLYSASDIFLVKFESRVFQKQTQLVGFHFKLLWGTYVLVLLSVQCWERTAHSTELSHPRTCEREPSGLLWGAMRVGISKGSPGARLWLETCGSGRWHWSEKEP